MNLNLKASILVILSLVFMIINVNYTYAYIPRSGILSPEEVDFGGKTVTILIRDLNRVVFNAGESLPAPDQYSIKKLAFRGDLYGFGVTYALFNGTMMITMYNKDLIASEGLEDPYVLWKAGQWTYDTMEAYGIALTKDTTGDGTIDQWGIGDIANAAAFYRFAPSNGAELAKQNESGKWGYAFNDPAAIDSMNTIARWRNELKIMGDGDFNTGKVAIVPHTHLAGARHALAAGVNVGYVPQPMGPHVDSYQWPTFDFASNFLPINTEYPEGLLALVDFLFREEDGEEFLDLYINTYMTSREHADVYMSGAEEWQGEGDIFQNTELWSINDGAVMAVLRGEKGAASAMDEVAQQSQAFLDDLFSQ